MAECLATLVSSLVDFVGEHSMTFIVLGDIATSVFAPSGDAL